MIIPQMNADRKCCFVNFMYVMRGQTSACACACNEYPSVAIGDISPDAKTQFLQAQAP